MEKQMVMMIEGGGGGGHQKVMNNGAVSGESDVVVGELMEVIETVGSYGGFRKTQRKECLNMVRRLKLLVPLLEEIREIVDDNKSAVHSVAFYCLSNLKKALLPAKKLLKNCNCGSKIYLALEGEAVMSRFHAVYDKLNQALDDVPFDELGISIEVKEQVELMLMQLKRAKRRTDTQDIELAMDLMVVFSKADDRNADSAVLERLANKLELHTIADLKAETLAVRKLVKERGGQNADSVQQIIDLLGKFKQITGFEENMVSDGSISYGRLQRCQTLLVPHEFLCPISLEIMTDPVIVATGQTYERESIQKWLNSNHRTCPKTRQILDHSLLAPNYALRNLIVQWCEKNNVDLPKKDSSVGSDGSSAELIDEISSLVQNLSSPHLNIIRQGVVKIRMLSKENPDNRILIANNGGIPPLVQLLSYPDSKIQEQTVTALLNLSLDETNKRLIAREGAIPAIIEILQNGTCEARENSATALFSLSMLDENKVMVGNLKGIPPLVNLLQNETIRGKKDAATALFNLSLNQANKSRAIKAGIIPSLHHLLEDKSLGMVDEALSILQLLASHPEARNEIGKLLFVETLVEIIKNGTPKNKECATSVLLELGLNNSSCILAALQFGVYEHLIEMTRGGTNRAQRKANSLLQHMNYKKHRLRVHTDTVLVGGLQTYMAKHFGFPPNEPRVYKGIVLEEDRTLGSYNIGYGHRIYLQDCIIDGDSEENEISDVVIESCPWDESILVHYDDIIEFHAFADDYRRHHMRAHVDAPVGALQTYMAKHLGFPPDEPKLYKGLILKKDRSLRSYGICLGHALYSYDCLLHRPKPVIYSLTSSDREAERHWEELRESGLLNAEDLNQER